MDSGQEGAATPNPNSEIERAVMAERERCIKEARREARRMLDAADNWQSKPEVGDRLRAEARCALRIAEVIASGLETVPLRPETVSENIARDMREGRFPKRSQPQMVPDVPPPTPA